MRLKTFIVKTFEGIIDPLKTTKITRDLFDVKHLLSKISKRYLKYLNADFKKLKESCKYNIRDDDHSQSNSPLNDPRE